MLDVALGMTKGEVMATRSRERSTRKVSAPTAAEVPVTRAMLGKLRTEVLKRIDQAREEAKADAQRLDNKIDAVHAGLKAEIREIRAENHEMKAALCAMQAQMARIELLVEEQNARNQIVLDGIAALLGRQNQLEERVAQVEDMVRQLAQGRPSS